MAESQPKSEQNADAINRNPRGAGVPHQQDVATGSERAAETQARAAERAGEGTKRAAEAGAEALRRTGEMTAKAADQGARATEAGVRAATDVAREGASPAGQGVDRIAQNTAEQIEHMGRLVSETTRDAAQMMRMMMWPASSGGVRDVQRAAGGMLNRLIEANMQIAEDTLRRNGPTELFSVQQRFMRSFLDTLTSGSAELLRAVQQITEESQRSVEQRNRPGAQASGGGKGGGGEAGGTVGDVMARDVRIVSPDDTVQHVAQIMTEQDTGAVPVGENDRLVGMVSDRDIAISVAAGGRDPGRTKVRDVMSREIRYCFEDDDLGHVAANMVDLHVRRLPVMNRDKRLVGVVSLGDMLAGRSARLAAQALQENGQTSDSPGRRGRERQDHDKGTRQPA
jgi:CBS domain-containing protein